MFHIGVFFSWGCFVLLRVPFSFLHRMRFDRLRVAANPCLSKTRVLIVVVPDSNSVLGPGRGDVPHVVVLGFDGCDLGLFWAGVSAFLSSSRLRFALEPPCQGAVGSVVPPVVVPASHSKVF